MLGLLLIGVSIIGMALFTRRVNRRQEQFDKSAAGRAAKAQMAALAKQSSVSNKGEPVLKVSGIAYHYFLHVFPFFLP